VFSFDTGLTLVNYWSLIFVIMFILNVSIQYDGKRSKASADLGVAVAGSYWEIKIQPAEQEEKDRNC
jgi:ABC-type spermidine/putrescine transport system permease subunit I